MKRVPGPDAAFLYAETPTWHMHVAAVTILDPADAADFSVARLREVLRRRIHRVPQLRWVVLETPLGLDRPWFVDDPHFDPGAHIRHVALPAPGGRRELGELVGDLVSVKLDRHRPLWEVWVIEGLEGGRVALLTKVHHAIIDGVSGADLATILYDLEAEPPEDPEPPAYEPGPHPSLARRLVGTGTELATMPLRALGLMEQSVEQAAVLVRHLAKDVHAPMAFEAPRTSFNGPLGPRRGFAYASASLTDTRHVKDVFGVKVNDVVLAAIGGSLREYLDDRGELPNRALIAQVPVSLRTDDNRSQIGTLVGTMFCSLATDVDDPVERLQAIHESTETAKSLREALARHKHVNLSDATPPAFFNVFARVWTAAQIERRSPPVFNLIVSNVPGPPFDLWCAGARVVSIHPTGPPLAAGGLNITALSNAHNIEFGLLSCRDLVPDPWPIADAIPRQLDVLVRAANRRRRRRRTRPTVGA